MESSADPLSASQQRYGLDAESNEKAEDNAKLGNGTSKDAEGPRKHMSAHERRLQKKQVPSSLRSRLCKRQDDCKICSNSPPLPRAGTIDGLLNAPHKPCALLHRLAYSVDTSRDNDLQLFCFQL